MKFIGVGIYADATVLVPRHGYHVLAVHRDANGNVFKIRLYNPHGEEVEINVEDFNENFDSLWTGDGP